MNNDIEATILEYQTYLKQRCPYFSPAIFPSYFHPNSISKLFVKSNHKIAADMWISNINNKQDKPHFSFPSVIIFQKREIIIQSIEVV